MTKLAWRRNYVYVRAYALQSAGQHIVYHALPMGDGPYWPPKCLSGDINSAVLVRRSHMEAIGAKPCKRCHGASA